MTLGHCTAIQMTLLYARIPFNYSLCNTGVTKMQTYYMPCYLFSSPELPADGKHTKEGFVFYPLCSNNTAYFSSCLSSPDLSSKLSHLHLFVRRPIKENKA